jgi:PKD repeat protein
VPSLPPPSSPPPQSPSPSPQTPGLRTFTLAAHGKAVAQFTVTKGSPSATFTTTHTGQGKVKVTLVTPPGDVIDSSTPGKVFVAKQANSDAYLVGHPGPGLWQVKVVVASAPAPVNVSVRFAQSPHDNAAPVARGKQTLKGRVVTVDATASTDKDGTIGTYMWDFGDGTIGSGAQTTHEYAAPGTYTINLVVEDDQTGLGFRTLAPIMVTK